MGLNSSGPISLAGATTGQSIAVELGLSATGTISLNDTAVRTLAGVASGAIIMPTNFYGKSNRAVVTSTFTTSTSDASLNVSGLSGYVAGMSDITVTVNGGVYLWTNSTGSYGLSLSGATSGDTITLVNNGYIMGKGGSGAVNSAGNPGGPALNVASIGVSSITINNTNGSAYIGGGGGSAGSGYTVNGAGGGAGGGTGGSMNNAGLSRPGGAGGGIGSSGSNGVYATQCNCGTIGQSSGAGGGRIFPGSGGAGGNPPAGGGAGGGGGAGSDGYAGTGGSGGSANNAGGAGGEAYGAGGGGGWGAYGGAGIYVGGGAAGGKAVNLGGKSVTWTSGNTTRVYGAVS